jgi:mono/diheme cytochrome c family protein
MYRTAFRCLFVAAALFLTTTACDSGDAKKTEDAKKTDDAKADGADATKKAGGEPEPTTAAEVEPEPAPTPEAAEAGEAAAEAGEAAAEAGEAEEPPEAEAPPEAEEPKPSKTEKAPTEKAPADKPEATAKVNGKPLFDGKCKSCHGADGKGDTTIGKKVDIPSLAGTKLSKAKVVKIVEDGVSGTKMKGYKEKLSKDEIDAVAAYVLKL